MFVALRKRYLARQKTDRTATSYRVMMIEARWLVIIFSAEANWSNTLYTNIDCAPMPDNIICIALRAGDRSVHTCHTPISLTHHAYCTKSRSYTAEGLAQHHHRHHRQHHHWRFSTPDLDRSLNGRGSKWSILGRGRGK
ncbi:uncharacterized protein LOC120906609 [Anopheles arabiensis]|uniref:uncharacterized protein LOC120906609 n=1 Tax=Anopheles arabiensis TaxID=7173 RepID=UPI001AAC5B2E|nr:uncharacterized protein LOC120906609 [Anopheles arabiensis]